MEDLLHGARTAPADHVLQRDSGVGWSDERAGQSVGRRVKPRWDEVAGWAAREWAVLFLRARETEACKRAKEAARRRSLRAPARLLAVSIPCPRFRRTAEAEDPTLSIEMCGRDASGSVPRVLRMGARVRGHASMSRLNEGGDAMRIVDRVEKVGRGREIKAAGTVCMAAAWILFATPALAQDANGMAQNGADLNGRRRAGRRRRSGRASRGPTRPRLP